MRIHFLVFSILFLCIGMSSCKKNTPLSSGGQLRFSTDTLLFDTVFVSLGSATYQFKIFNQEDQPIKISSIRLAKGQSSPFRLNVNGISGNEVNDQELAPKDSLYVYSTVTIDPNSSLSPFVVEDQLIATLNGKDFSLPFLAYGQNARYVFDSVLSTQTWDNVLPYVIINNALVDQGQTLKLNPGCRVYVHPNSRLFVEGTLIANGTKSDSIVFQSDRLDRNYFPDSGLPGEWGGLYFTQNSRGNRLNWVKLRNCGNSTALGNSFVQPAAIQVDNNPSISLPHEGLQMDNCIIENSIGYGVLSFGGKVQMRNCLVHTCGAQNIAFFQGGNFDAAQCTFVTYGTRWLSHTENPVMSLLNYLDTSQTGYIPASLSVRVRNSIVYGTLENELVSNQKGTGLFDVQFFHCLIRAKEVHPAINFVNCIFNQDPQFVDYDRWNFRLNNTSPAVNAGIAPFFYPNLDDQSGGTNLGAF